MRVLKFLDETYLPGEWLPNSYNDGPYTRKMVTLAEVFANLNLRAQYVSDMTQSGFASFCGKNREAFVEHETQTKERKRNVRQ